VEASKIIVEETKLFKITVSFGSVASLISLPCYMSHASIPAATRAARGLPDDLVRISTGIEDVDDLLADLEQAMNKAAEQVGWAGDGFKAAPAASMSARELELMNRVQELEAQLGAR
jgi:cysteine-S-conjugate beta-lyase